MAERERERCKDMTPPVSILWLRWNTHDSTVTLRYALTLLHLAAAGGRARVKGRRQEGGMKGEVWGRTEGKEEVEKVWKGGGEEEGGMERQMEGREGTAEDGWMEDDHRGMEGRRRCMDGGCEWRNEEKDGAMEGKRR